jgi:hypothetical protein
MGLEGASSVTPSLLVKTDRGLANGEMPNTAAASLAPTKVGRAFFHSARSA